MQTGHPEDAIAEKILKRAEIARITRQLKNKLFKAGMKVRESQGKSLTSSSPLDNSDPLVSESSPTTSPLKRKSSDDEEAFSSPAKRAHHANIPSSPFYPSNTPINYLSVERSPTRQKVDIAIPKTPPLGNKVILDDIALTKSAGAHKESLTGSAHSVYQSALFSTPKSSKTKKAFEFKTPNSKYVNENEEGADLLLYLSNSPARTVNSKEGKEQSTFLNIPTTPKSSHASMLNLSSTPNLGIESTPPRGTSTALPFSTPSLLQPPSTPGNSSILGAKLFGATKNGSRTPAFSMSDYVSIFTPSPRHTRTPEFSHSFVKPAVLSYSKELNGITKSEES
ncbi:hypothetical protein OGAPHI_003591 [Ogataea philodendri]|uniref:Uncharacterized protein n=1 Tax=Ogataea philodendri TaxID=1378263 RepID=A0A9P8P534_9ASCO|nr:uncharacterized protein OGAPHI_003591 [Ogataea philodendri]KAH3665407.1 hypothetical protein OGAPHI_003591 [Ogataea philodendri]